MPRAPFFRSAARRWTIPRFLTASKDRRSLADAQAPPAAVMAPGAKGHPFTPASSSVASNLEDPLRLVHEKDKSLHQPAGKELPQD